MTPATNCYTRALILSSCRPRSGGKDLVGAHHCYGAVILGNVACMLFSETKMWPQQQNSGLCLRAGDTREGQIDVGRGSCENSVGWRSSDFPHLEEYDSNNRDYSCPISTALAIFPIWSEYKANPSFKQNCEIISAAARISGQELQFVFVERR